MSKAEPCIESIPKCVGHLSEHAIVALLKACGKLKDVSRGIEVHKVLTRSGLLQRNLFVGSALVDMYTKCGALAKAHEAYDELAFRDTVTSNVLLVAYAEHGYGEDAIHHFQQMKLEGLLPNAATYACSLKASAGLGATREGLRIHAEVAKRKELAHSVHVGNALVDMYGKCGLLDEAQAVFEDLPVHDVVSWNALIGSYCKHGFLAKASELLNNLAGRDTVSWNVLISGYVEHGHSVEALACFENMQLEGVPPNHATYISCLKACGSMADIDKGEQIHIEVARRGILEKNPILGSILVDMYVKCGLLAKGHEVLNKLGKQDSVSMTALVAGYAKKGLFLQAQDVLDNLLVRNVVAWNAIISGYTEHGHGEEALKCLDQMQIEGVSPNAGTFVPILRACSSMGAVDKGSALHAEVLRNGLFESDICVGNTLVDMYIKSNQLSKARHVFEELPVKDSISWNALIAGYSKVGLLVDAEELFEELAMRDVVSWNALVTGYTEYGQGEKALECYEQMRHEAILPDFVTFICCLKACGSIGSIDKGQELHTKILCVASLQENVTVFNSLLDMYAKCGSLVKAQAVFDMRAVQDVISWNALIAGYVVHGHDKEAIKCFDQMHSEGVSPDTVTLICILKACGSMGAADKVLELHADICSKGLLLEGELIVANTLVDALIKCGLVEEAQEVFDKLPIRDVVSWNAFVAGIVELRQSEDGPFEFEKMTMEGVEPNLITFLNIITACNHGGLFGKGHQYFEAMGDGYGMIPAQEHRNCLLDLLGRAGHPERAVRLLSEVPLLANPVGWHAVLDSCRKWGNVRLGEQAFKTAVQFDQYCLAAYAHGGNRC